jgi:adenylate kinase family enzyme
VIHLDAEYWRPGWDPTPSEEWQKKVEELVARPEWIMDGNYGGTMARRLAACDTVIFLDLPRALCLFRVLARRLRFRGRSRTELPADCPERLSFEFLRWIWTYPARRRGGILKRLSELGSGKRVMVLRSRREIERFLAAVEDPYTGRP